MPKTLHIVFQTHWDREWYYAFETYRYRLIHVLRRVIKALEQNEISTFILDGQTLPLEDYLFSAEPHEKEKVFNFIKENRIVIGPWYIAADEFLVQGESLIRNLELGHKQALAYGKVQKLGYIPDTFGHIGQMPQILAGFDITNAMMWRGVDAKKNTFIWEGIDGTKLFSVFLSEGYYQPIINQDDYIEATKQYIDKIEKMALTDDLLLTAGGDHIMPVDLHLGNRLASLSKAIPNLSVKVTDYQTFIEEIKHKIDFAQLEHIQGELRSNKNCYILPNVLSTRSYLKVNNQHLEDLMVGFIEPLMALKYLNFEHAPKRYLDQIWENILQNQPHDSICGCSIDPVHSDNEKRTQWAFEQIESLKDGIFEDTRGLPMQYFNHKDKKIFEDDTRFSLFNPNPYVYQGVATFGLYLHEQNPFISGFKIKDIKTGVIYDIDILSKNAERMFKSPLEYPPGFRKGFAFQIGTKVKLNPLSMTDFELIQSPETKPSIKSSYEIENNQITLTLNLDGTLDLKDKTSGRCYQNIHKFESSIDCGDAYNYAKPDFDVTSVASLHKKPKISVYKSSQKLTYQLIIDTPKGLSEDRKSLVKKQVKSKIDIQCWLYENADHVTIETTIENQAMDQRMRIRYPLGKVIEHTYSDSVFEIKQRMANRIESFEAPRQKEVPVVVDPSLSMIFAKDCDQSLWIGHRGLHEYQTIKETDETVLYHTIIRSVGYLSHDDFKTRGGAAGPNLKTPEAQCLRSMTFQYQIGITLHQENQIDVYKSIQTFRKPIMKLSGLSTDESGKSLLSLSNQNLILTSLRYVSLGHLEARIWNPTDQLAKTNLNSDHQIEEIIETNMLRAYEKTHSSMIEVRPHEVKTIQLIYPKVVNN